MSDDFQNRMEIRSVRKPHECEHCGRKIEVGNPAIKTTGQWDGYFYALYEHPECEAAGLAYAKETGYWGDEFTWFQHVDLDEYDLKPWLLENAPIVAARMKIELEKEDAA
jgi:hypothetical protein